MEKLSLISPCVFTRGTQGGRSGGRGHPNTWLDGFMVSMTPQFVNLLGFLPPRQTLKLANTRLNPEIVAVKFALEI